jgi:hypothetical protein
MLFGRYIDADFYYKWFAAAPNSPQFTTGPKYSGRATLTAKMNASYLIRCPSIENFTGCIPQSSILTENGGFTLGFNDANGFSSKFNNYSLFCLAVTNSRTNVLRMVSKTFQDRIYDIQSPDSFCVRGMIEGFANNWRLECLSGFCQVSLKYAYYQIPIPTSAPSQSLSPTFVNSPSSSPTIDESVKEISKSVPETVLESLKKLDSTNMQNISMINRIILNSNRTEQVSGEYVGTISSRFGLVKLSGRYASLNSSLPSDNPSVERNAEFLSFAIRKLVDTNGFELSDMDAALWKFQGPESMYNSQSRLNYIRYFASTESSVMNSKKEQKGKVILGMFVDFHTNAGKVQYGDSYIDVFPGSVKFAFNISNWPFQNPMTDRLYLGISCTSSGTGEAIFQGRRISIGDGFFDVPFFAIADEKIVPIKVLYEKASVGQQSLLLFDFPAFSKRVFYDPLASLNSNAYSKKSEANPSSSWFTESNIIILSCSVGAVFLISGVILILRKRKSGKSSEKAIPLTNLKTTIKKTGKKGEVLSF